MSASSGQAVRPVFVPAHSVQIPSWKTVYEKTVWETDTEKLVGLVHATEKALYLRWQELAGSTIRTEERAALKAAAGDLWAIKIHKLGWPGLHCEETK